MRGLSLIISVMALLLLAPAVGRAQAGSNESDYMDYMVTEVLRSKFLTLDCPLPPIQPKVTTLTRSWVPDTDELLKRFFGQREAIMGEQTLDQHMIWGRGKRYKSGTVIYLMGRDQMLPQNIASVAKEIEIVPSYLDVYRSGYEYKNNIGHRAVHATDVKKTSESAAKVSYYDVYSEEEGQETAEKLLAEMHGELTVSDDFRIKKIPIIQDFSERLFVYKANPEYLTEYNIYSSEVDLTKSLEDRQKVSSQQVAVEVWDVYATVMLDGDKLLAGMAYFWDNGLKATGTPRECIHSGTAMVTARDYVFEAFNGEPPLLNVSNIKLGFIQDPTNTVALVPVWFFDAWHVQTLTLDQSGLKNVSPITSPYAKNLVQIPFPLAVNALTEEVYILDKSQLP